jgi:adenylate cyclase
MTDRLSPEELADRTGVDSERIEQLVTLGLLEPEDGGFAVRDVMRVRVVGLLEAIGIETTALAEALTSGHLRLGYLESAGRRYPRSRSTFAEMADQMGVAFSTIDDLYVAFGLPRPRADEQVPEDDFEALKMLAVFSDAGLAERDIMRIARVWGDSTRRIAQYLPHFFHRVIEERFRERGLGDNDAYEAALREVGVRVGRSGEDLLGWLFRRHSDLFGVQHQFDHVETALEQAGVRRRPPRPDETAVFADLSDFTRLTEHAGDDLAAEVAVSFAQLAGEVAARFRGEVVKLLGDGVFLVFRDPDDAVMASLEMVDSAPTRGLPEAHIGVNTGPMLYDQGDYFGRTVNIAARIATEAGPSQVFLGEPAARTVAAEGFRLNQVGEFELKGIAEPVLLFQATRAIG